MTGTFGPARHVPCAAMTSIVRLSFVCLGNICRSPTAEGVAKHLIAQWDLGGVEVESAGTAGYHVGKGPDARAVAVASARQIEVGGQARRFDVTDLDRLDMVVAMDRQNLAELKTCAKGHATPIRLLREWDPEADGVLDVPDPYYGGSDGFEDVLDIVTRSVEALLDGLAPDLDSVINRDRIPPHDLEF